MPKTVRPLLGDPLSKADADVEFYPHLISKSWDLRAAPTTVLKNGCKNWSTGAKIDSKISRFYHFSGLDTITVGVPFLIVN